jgi:hypothetical protein
MLPKVSTAIYLGPCFLQEKKSLLGKEYTFNTLKAGHL